jgi:cysteinyl-tRNA synthetase, unknown class
MAPYVRSRRFNEASHCVAGYLIAALLFGLSVSARAQTTQLNKIRSWAYQLQDVDPMEVKASAYDLIVLDYGFSKAIAATYPREIVDLMRVKPNGERRSVFAYLSVGEAEDYRYYWDDTWRKQPPKWLAAENPEWPGHSLVQYWDANWQALLFGKPGAYLDRILDAGYDGVYLDGIDKFEPWKSTFAADAMIGLVWKISRYVRAKRKNFFVIPQNGDALLYSPYFLQSIDGMSREDLLYNEKNLAGRNTPDSIAQAVSRLKTVAATGKPVLVVEYPTNNAFRPPILDEIRKLGFVGYVADRALNTLTPPNLGPTDQGSPSVLGRR